jgi:hypothetical protein
MDERCVRETQHLDEIRGTRHLETELEGLGTQNDICWRKGNPWSGKGVECVECLQLSSIKSVLKLS